MHTLKVRKIGNSLGVILPKELQEQLQVKEGDTLYAVPSPNGMEVGPYDPEFESDMELFDEEYRRYRNAFRELAK